MKIGFPIKNIASALYPHTKTLVVGVRGSHKNVWISIHDIGYHFNTTKKEHWAGDNPKIGLTNDPIVSGLLPAKIS